jgi:Tol biopolymer transport system component
LTRITANHVGGHDTPGSFSPDGTHIVFVRVDQDDNPVGLFTVRTTGSHLQQLHAAGTLINIGADWSAKNNEIVFSRHLTSAVRGSLCLIHPDGTGLHPLHI